MPKYDVKQFFTFKRVTPSALQQDNLIQFSYHSPNGIHDKFPLVYVIEKQLDRFYGLNLHYDSNQLVEIIDNTTEKVDQFLEAQWFKKYPKNKQKLYESDGEFSRKLIEQKDLREFERRIPRKDIEQFLLTDKNDQTFRCYLFKRMNGVSKCIFKI